MTMALNPNHFENLYKNTYSIKGEKIFNKKRGPNKPSLVKYLLAFLIRCEIRID